MCQHYDITNAMRYGMVNPAERCCICKEIADPPRIIKKMVYCDEHLSARFEELAMDMADILVLAGIHTDEEACKEFIETCYREMEERI